MGRGLDLLLRLTFLGWALLLFTLTHWPNLKVDAGIPRTDLWGHAIGYSIWASLFIATGWPGKRGTWKSVGLGMPIAMLYSGLDELSQGIPILGRFVTWEDFAANRPRIGSAAWVVALLVLDARSIGRSNSL